MYVSIWEFQVKKGSESEFERLYGSEGPWVKLSKNDEGYIKTELFRDLYHSHRYVRVDYWGSQEACVTFLNANRDEFAALDKQCKMLIEKEAILGEFMLSEE
jgi:heme-degrading monooxygenase HmoA